MSADLDFSNRVVVITGAGGGLGKCYALYFARLGAKVVVNDLGGSRSGDGASKNMADVVVNEIKGAGGIAVANYDSVENGQAIIKTAIDAFGRVDVVICNAGILRDKSFIKMTDDDWNLVHRVHMRGSYSVARAAFPYMRDQKYGRIIMTSSGAGIYGNFGQANYSAAKLGILGLSNTLAIEGAKRNVFCNTIAPVAASRLTQDIFPPQLFEKLGPETVAPLVLALCHESSTVNGAVFELGGGWYSRLRWQRTEGASLHPSELSPELLASSMAAISNFEGPTMFPTSGSDAMGAVMSNLSAHGGGPFAAPSLLPPQVGVKGRLLRYDGKVTIVTGAGGGLGRTYALLLASRGAKVVVNDLGGTRSGSGTSSRMADAVVAEIRSSGGDAVANYDSVLNGEAIVATAIKAFGRLDIVINNAGILRDKAVHNMSDEDFDLVHQVHLHGAYAVTKAAWPYMREQKYGRVIMTASAAGIYGNFGQANYASAKLALVGLCNTLAREGAKVNVLVNTIAPLAGSRLTEDVFPPNLLEALKPECVAMTVAALVHEECSVNGGLFELGAGWISRLRWQRSRGVYNDKATAAFVLQNMDTISNFQNGMFPDAISSALQEISSLMAGPAAGSSSSSSAAAGNKFVQPDKVLGKKFPDSSFTYTPRDLMLYALSIGCGAANPLEPSEQSFIYENSSSFQAFPTYGVIVPNRLLSSIVGMEGLSFNPMMLLHGEQYMEVRNPIPTDATLVTHGRVHQLLDKGDKGAVLTVEGLTKDSATGKEIFLNRFTVFIRGIGNFGGDRGAATPPLVLPSRAPDASMAEKTTENQAALYRLNGDYNPLHLDPGMAAVGGFAKPILHGLCTFGFAARAVLKHFADNDGSRFKSISVRFAKSVYPGETIVTDMWQVSPTRIMFESKVLERNVAVLQNAVIELHPASGAPGPAASLGGSGSGSGSGSSSGSGSGSGSGSSKSEAFFESLTSLLASDPSVIKRVGKVFNFVIDGVSWHIDLKNGSGAIRKGDKSAADCTFTLGDADFGDLMAGKLNPQQAFMSGKVKIAGDLGAAQKLSALQSSSKM